jgi:AbrB family looped-hinge helix DNA binding protein
MGKHGSSVSPKGQVTIPLDIRQEFGIEPKDRVTFHIVNGEIVVRPTRQRLLEFRGKFHSRVGPVDWKTERRIAYEEVARNAANEGIYADEEQD